MRCIIVFTRFLSKTGVIFLFVGVLTSCTVTAAGEGTQTPIATGISGARLYVEPDDGVQPVVQFIENAHQTLDVAMYLLSDRTVVAALIAAENRGTRVRVLLEENPYGTGPGNASVEAQLRDARIATGWSPTTFQLSHDKYAISDGKAALVGTANWTHSAFTSNREYVLVVDAPADVAQLETLFNADWNRQPVQLVDANLVISPLNSRRDFVGLIDSAKSTIDVEAEEMQDGGVEDALTRAVKRHVNVRVILPSAQGRDANAPGRNRISASGVPVRILHSPYVHAKDIVVDGREAFVGSENISTPSLDLNREVGLLVEDKSVIGRLVDTFGRDWTAAQP